MAPRTLLGFDKRRCTPCQVDWLVTEGPDCWSCGQPGEKGAIAKPIRGCATWPTS